MFFFPNTYFCTEYCMLLKLGVTCILEEYLLQTEAITHSFIVCIRFILSGQSKTSFICNKALSVQALT